MRVGDEVVVFRGMWRGESGKVNSLDRDEVMVVCEDGGSFHTKQENVIPVGCLK